MVCCAMPTTAERHALLFLAAVAVIGSGVRVASTQHFLQQVSAGEGHESTAGIPPGVGAKALASQIAAVDSARATRAARAAKPKPPRTSGRTPPASPSKPPPALVDVNRASATELERLPRVGPALAQRIIAWRDANGPFRSVDDLRHVRGIGPATAALLAQSVTF